MKKWLFSTFTLLLLIGLILSGCSSQENENDNASNNDEKDKLTVYTTLFPLQDFTQKIGGRHVTVENIIPPGSDAHTFEPTTKMMMELAEADLFIYNGAGMETYAESMADSLENENVTIIEAAKGINLTKHGHNHEHEEEYIKGKNEDKEHAEEGHSHGDNDPHVWLDPTLSIQLAENIKDQLVKQKPEEQAVFEENFKQLKQELEKLDEEFHATVKDAANPRILVSHAAYGYWEQAYGIEQISISGLSPTNEPSQKQLEEIITTAKANKINYVLFEQNVKPKVADIIKNELQADTLQLHNLSVLTEKEIEDKEDYFSLMKKNLKTLQTAMND